MLSLIIKVCVIPIPIVAPALLLPNTTPQLSSSSLSQRITRTSPLHAYAGDNNIPSDDIDIDAERKRLERLLRPRKQNNAEENSQKSTNQWRSQLDHPEHSTPPPMSPIAKQRILNEIDLLSSLSTSDDALSDLWAFWFAECGPTSAISLLSAEELVSRGPQQWPAAEARLRAIIDEHGPRWAEPVNRLATLLYQQGRLKESRELCEMVLSVKPWHFGALSGIVLVCAGMGDRVTAKIWADRRLPPLRSHEGNDRREVWVKRAVSEAMAELRRAATLEKSMEDKSDDETTDDDSLEWHFDSSGESWQ